VGPLIADAAFEAVCGCAKRGDEFECGSCHVLPRLDEDTSMIATRRRRVEPARRIAEEDGEEIVVQNRRDRLITSVGDIWRVMEGR